MLSLKVQTLSVMGFWKLKTSYLLSSSSKKNQGIVTIKAKQNQHPTGYIKSCSPISCSWDSLLVFWAPRPRAAPLPQIYHLQDTQIVSWPQVHSASYLPSSVTDSTRPCHCQYTGLSTATRLHILQGHQGLQPHQMIACFGFAL